MKNKIKLTTIIITSLYTSSLFAQTDEIAILKAQLAQQSAVLQKMQKQLDALEQQDSAEKESNSSMNDKQSVAKISHITSTNDSGFFFSSYGTVLYKNAEIFANVQDVTPERRARVDMERVVTEFGYKFNDNWEVEVELEYEHGGTGVTLEYDGFEEFGEFESEVEIGGEVVVEKMEVKYTYSPELAVKFGHIYVPVGLGTDLNKPHQYFTTERHWSEASMIPQVWHETGVNIVSQIGGFKLQGLITTGLNSEYFRTTGWVSGGLQQQFEYSNADDLALTLRADYGDVKTGKGVGVSFYTGNTNGNRHNSGKTLGDGNLTILGLHGVWNFDNLIVRGQYLYGELEDAAEITLANKTTPGLKPGNFALVGSKAESLFVEAGYNLQDWLQLPSALTLFTSYEFANPTKEIAVGAATERFNISEFSVGLNYMPIEQIVLKLQGSSVMYKQDNLDDTSTLSMSVGYLFSL